MCQKPRWRGLSVRGTQQTILVESTSSQSSNPSLHQSVGLGHLQKPSIRFVKYVKRTAVAADIGPDVQRSQRKAGTPVSHDCRSLAVQRAWAQLQRPKHEDISLCASNASGLHHILDHFADYCKANGLIIIPASVRQWCSLVVVHGRGPAGLSRNLTLQALSPGEESWHDGVQKFKYLGVELHGSSSITAAVGQRLACMVAAQSAVYRRLREMHVTYDPVIIADMFETITAASGRYGCEIWSTPMLSSWYAITSCSLQRYQASVYK
jgi:hypothetical protein